MIQNGSSSIVDHRFSMKNINRGSKGNKSSTRNC